jgi:hypothetical protein
MKMMGYHNTFDEITDIYKNENVLLWPPEQSPTEIDPALDALYEVMNPSGCTGIIRGAWDERSMVYSIEEAGGTHAVVFLSWDPAIHLKGVKRYPGPPKVGEVSGAIGGKPSLEATLPCEGKGKGKAKEPGNWHPIPEPNTTSCADGSTASPKPANSGGPAQWQKRIPAMYQAMPGGFHFAF